MTIHRTATRRDANEREIIDALRAAGATVQQLSAEGVPDLLVGYHGRTILVEIKTAKGKLTSDEFAWLDKWDGHAPYIVRTVEQALGILESFE